MLSVDSVGPLAAFGLEGLDGVPGLLHRAGHEPADRVLLPTHFFHDLKKRGAVLAVEHRHHLGGLAALARPSAFLFLAAFLASN